jgi:hypothetical protein
MSASNPIVSFADLEEWAEASFSENAEYSFDDVIRATDPRSVNEASLGYVYQQFKKSQRASWAILTSWRPELTEAENKRALEDCKNRLKQWGCLRITCYRQEETDDEVFSVASEPSFFVIGISMKSALKLTRRYEQRGIVYAGPEVGGDVCLVFQDGTVETRTERFHPGRVAQLCSALRDRPIFFEARVESWMQGLAYQHRNIPPIPGLPRRLGGLGSE